MGKFERAVITNMNAEQLDEAYRSHLSASVGALPDMKTHRLHIKKAQALLLAFQAKPLGEKMEVIRARRNR